MVPDRPSAPVFPAEAGIHVCPWSGDWRLCSGPWIPAFAGKTGKVDAQTAYATFSETSILPRVALE